MTRTWRDVALELAGPAATVREIRHTTGGDEVGLECVMPGSVFRLSGGGSADLWRRLAYELAGIRLVDALGTAGWRIVEEVIEETMYVVAEDPGGTTWAIGVAGANDHLRSYLERDLALEERADRVAVVDPLATRSADELMKAPDLRRSDSGPLQ